MINPEVFSIGVFHIRWYGVMVAIGLLAGYWLQLKRGKRYDFTQNNISDITFWAMVAGLAGGRLLYVIRFWDEQFSGSFVDVFKVYEGGLVFLGGLGGAVAAVLLLCFIHRWPVWKAADLLAPALPLGHAFGRIGCLLNGCCHGFQYHGICSFSYKYVPWPTFPIQLLAFFVNIAICIFLLFLEKKQKCQKKLFMVYMLLYCLGRFLLEFGRGDYPPEQLSHGLTPAQITCLWLAPLVLVVYGAACKLKTGSAK